MKKLQTYLSGIAAVLLLAALGACTDDDKTLNDVYLETDASYYSANARGLTYNGEEVVIRIKSNTYWMVTYDKGTGLEEPWFTLAREGGNGSADLAVTVQRNDGNAAAAELYLVGLFFVQIRYLIVSLDYCVFDHVVNRLVDNGNKLFVAGLSVLANKTPKRACVADDVVIIYCFIESRIVAVNEAAVVLDLVDKEARGVLNKLGSVLLVHGVDLASAVIVNVTYEIVDLVVFVAHPAYAFENNIAVRQGRECAAAGFFQVCVQIAFVNAFVFVVEYLGTVKLGFQKCRFKVLVKGYAVSEKFGPVVVQLG